MKQREETAAFKKKIVGLLNIYAQHAQSPTLDPFLTALHNSHHQPSLLLEPIKIIRNKTAGCCLPLILSLLQLLQRTREFQRIKSIEKLLFSQLKRLQKEEEQQVVKDRIVEMVGGFMKNRKCRVKERTIKGLLRRGGQIGETIKSVLQQGGEREGMSKIIAKLLA